MKPAIIERWIQFRLHKIYNKKCFWKIFQIYDDINLCSIYVWDQPNKDELDAFWKCSARRWKEDGVKNTDYEIIEETNFNLYKNVTVDLKYGISAMPKSKSFQIITRLRNIIIWWNITLCKTCFWNKINEWYKWVKNNSN